jgi:Uma2 family endonuclease
VFGSRAHTRVQFPIHVPPNGLPEPDIAIVRGAIDDYAGHHPGGDDVVFVVEVAVTSLATDRLKAIEYARAGAPVYWLVDVTGRRLEIHSQPDTKTARYSVTTILDETRDVEIPETSERLSIAELLKR